MKAIKSQQRLNIVKGVLMIIIFVSCFGCHSKQKDLSLYAEKLKQANSSTMDTALPVIQPRIKMTYHSEGLPSPFKENFVASATKSTKEKNSIPAFSLDYPLNKLKLVGFLHKNNQLGAIIKTPSNLYFKVIEGSRIGQNAGVVSKIFYNKIEILEKEKVSSGTEKVQRYDIMLSKQQGT